MAINSNIRFPVLALTVVIAVLISSLVVPVWADFSIQGWRLFKPISIPLGHDMEFLVEIVPDSEIFANTLPGLSDVRIVEEKSQHEVQYKLLVEHGEQRRESTKVTMRDLAHSPGLHSKFVVDLGEEKFLHNELEIVIPSENFQRSVLVEGSTDGESWAVLKENSPIFDFRIKDRNFTTRDTRIRYPDSTARYLRVHVINEKEPPLEITGAVAYFYQQLAPRETEHSATIVSRNEDVEGKKTLLVLDMGNPGFPTNRLAVTTSQENFYRQVELNGSNDSKTWVIVQKSEILYDYNTPNFVGNDLSIHYPESTFRYFQIVIHNEDNPTLQIDSVRPYGFLRKFIFPASPDGIYRLYYGNNTAHTPSYELERIFPYLVTQNLPVAQLGNQSTNPLYAKHRPFTERYPWLLPAVVLVAASLIGLFLTNLLRQIKKLLPPPS